MCMPGLIVATYVPRTPGSSLSCAVPSGKSGWLCQTLYVETAHCLSLSSDH